MFKHSFLPALCLLIAPALAAQTPRRRPASRAVTAKPTVSAPNSEPSPPPNAVTASKPPTPLAILNGQTITTADIDPGPREEVEKLDERIADVRRQVLGLQINTGLLEAEARKRKLNGQQLYDMEVTKRVTDPTDAEINKFIEENRQQLDESTTVRPQVVAFLRGEREAKISDEFVQRLRKSNSVIMGADINRSGLDQSTVVATVAGSPIAAAVVMERLKPIVYKLRLNAYETEKEALDRTIDDLLLLSEANRRNLPPEDIVRTEVTEKLHHPNETEIAKFYSENKTQVQGDLDSARNQIVDYLDTQEQRRLELALSEKLRKGANLRILISPPEPPVQKISTDDDPSRGNANAPITIVEFTDFECPACAAMHPVLEEVLKVYADKVRFVVRDFPLKRHPYARKAAEAANAAHAQGKFFEYAALLFQRQKSLDIPSLKKYASELGLDRARFDRELDGGAYAAEVRHDLDDGEIYGVESTPTIFVNGVMLMTLSGEALRAEIDRALKTATSPSRPSPK